MEVVRSTPVTVKSSADLELRTDQRGGGYVRKTRHQVDLGAFERELEQVEVAFTTNPPAMWTVR